MTTSAKTKKSASKAAPATTKKAASTPKKAPGVVPDYQRAAEKKYKAKARGNAQKSGARRKDQWVVPWTSLRVNKKRNVRIDYDDLPAFAEQLKRDKKIKQTVRARMVEPGVFELTSDGYRRYFACEILYQKYGIDMEFPLALDPNDYGEDDMLADMLSFGKTGKPLTAYEFASGVLRLMQEHGWDENRIAERYNVSRPYIVRCRELANFQPRLVELVVGGDVAMAEAINLSVRGQQDEFLKAEAEGKFNKPSKQQEVSDDGPGAPKYKQAFMEYTQEGADGSTPAIPPAPSSGRTRQSRIKPKDIKAVLGGQSSTEVPVIEGRQQGFVESDRSVPKSSYELLKIVVKGFTGTPKSELGRELLLFASKIINNELTKEDIKEYFV